MIVSVLIPKWLGSDLINCRDDDIVCVDFGLKAEAILLSHLDLLLSHKVAS